jgi:hypothetical protein
MTNEHREDADRPAMRAPGSGDAALAQRSCGPTGRHWRTSPIRQAIELDGASYGLTHNAATSLPMTPTDAMSANATAIVDLRTDILFVTFPPLGEKTSTPAHVVGTPTSTLRFSVTNPIPQTVVPCSPGPGSWIVHTKSGSETPLRLHSVRS